MQVKDTIFNILGSKFMFCVLKDGELSIVTWNQMHYIENMIDIVKIGHSDISYSLVKK